MDTINQAISLSNNIESITVADQALEMTPELLGKFFDNRKVFIVADQNTMEAAGFKFKQILEQNGYQIVSYIFPKEPIPKVNLENAEFFMSEMKSHGAIPVSIGSGVITDLVKYASYQIGQSFVSIATAASMDGYASPGAPLSVKGFKKTIPCKPAKVIIADLDILTKAPVQMTAWGFGDRVGKVTAGADWLIADFVGAEKINPTSWDMVQGRLRADLSNPEGIKSVNKATIKDLFSGLVMVGIAGEIYGNQRPASGSEHQIAHLWEMEDLHFQGQPVSHGICVGLGTLTILSIYEWLLEQDLEKLDSIDIVKNRHSLDQLIAEIDLRFPSPDMAQSIKEETKAKYIDNHQLKNRIEKIRQNWANLRQKLSHQLMSAQEIKSKLEMAGIPAHPSEVGISNEYLRNTIIRSRLIRRRYTILDLLEETGLFNYAIDILFSKNGRLSY